MIAALVVLEVSIWGWWRPLLVVGAAPVASSAAANTGGARL